MPNPTNSTAWFPRCRMAWLERTAKQTGSIRRRDLTEAFGISPPQASGDFQEYLRINPKSLEYDLSEKTYRWNPKAKLAIKPAPWSGFPTA